jgi:hypothetical protein
MRTTLEIEDDVLEVAKDLARHQCVSLGKAVSQLLRKGIQSPERGQTMRNGLRIVNRPTNATPVTLETVNQIRDEVL